MGSFGTSRTARGSTVSEAVKRRAHRVWCAFLTWRDRDRFERQVRDAAAKTTATKRPAASDLEVGNYTVTVRQDGVEVARASNARITFTLATKDPA